MAILTDPIPTDRPHLLVQASVDEMRLKYACVAHNAELLHYRDNLLGRVGNADRFLALDRHVDRELEAIRTLCHDFRGKIVVLDGLDLLVTYLRARSAVFAQIFLKRLEQLRQLDATLWVVLPQILAPDDWPISRLRHLD